MTGPPPLRFGAVPPELAAEANRSSLPHAEMEPERKIDKLLRAYAKKRRSDAGEPLKLHPAARRVLQGEVSRRTPKPETEETSLSLWQLFRQQWAFLTGFALLVFLGAVLLLPALSGAKHKAENLSAMNNLKQIGIAAQMAAGENNGRLPASLDELSNQLDTSRVFTDPVSGKPFIYVAGGEYLDALQSNAVLAYSPKDMSGRAVLFADGRVELANRARFAELTNQKSFRLALADKVARDRLLKTPVSAPVAAQTAASMSEAANRLKEQKPGAARRQFLQTEFAGNQQNLYRNSLASAQTTPVLQSFQVLQNGDAISIVDRDGSVYRGSVHPANTAVSKPPPVEKPAARATPPPTGETLTPATRNEPTAVQNYFFRVAGTNRTSQQNVVFTGNLEEIPYAATNTQPITGGPVVSGQINLPSSTSQQQMPGAYSRVVGTAMIDHTNRIEINAVPVRR